MWSEYDDVFSYVHLRRYPDGASKDVKRRIREKSQSFAVVEGTLMHRGRTGKLCRVIVDVAEKDRIVASLHADKVGGSHFGQNATIQKVTDRFWWKSVADDTHDFVRGCQVCKTLFRVTCIRVGASVSTLA